MSGHEQRTELGLRSYCVHCADERPANTHTVEARSFSDAAIAFLERWHVPAFAEEVQVIVEASDTGERHCYTVDLGSGDAEPCG